MKRLVMFILLLSGAAQAAERGEPTIKVGEETRAYLLHVPASAPKENRPLVVAFHGGGTSAAVMEHFSGLSEKADAAGFVVAYPEGSGRVNRVLTWNAGACCGHAAERKADDVAFAAALIDELIAKVRVDPRRVYVTGMSNGAMMAYRVAAELPERVAAVAAVAGGLEIDPAAVRVPMPVLHFHGTADEYAPYKGGKGGRSGLGHAHRPVAETVATWVKVNGAEPFVVSVALADHDRNDGTRVVRHEHAAGKAGVEVVLYEIQGGGHTWPGRARREALLGATSMDVSANDAIWEFFSRHHKP
ncbi:MAG: prolyl oligopeptidase family serine peptidase [Magnetospirillum sp. WYHS-4]